MITTALFPRVVGWALGQPCLGATDKENERRIRMLANMVKNGYRQAVITVDLGDGWYEMAMNGHDYAVRFTSTRELQVNQTGFAYKADGISWEFVE